MGATTGHYDTHPAYRRQAYVVGKKVKFGENRTSIPNWEVEVSRGVPWFGGTTLASDDRGVNIAGVLFDWLTDDTFGLGIAEGKLETASWQATHDAIDDFRISPLITQQSDARSVIAQLLTYGDLWMCNAGGVIRLGYWQHNITDTSALPVIDDDALLEEPELSNSGFGETVNYVAVVYKDRAHYFHDAVSQPYVDRVNFDIVGELRPTWLQMPWLTDADLANQYAAQYGKCNALPRITGSLRVKRERVATLGLLPGSLAMLSSAALGLSIVFRVTELEWPADKDAGASLSVENERSLGPAPYVPAQPALPGNFVIDAVTISNARVRELPSGLKTAREPQVAILAQRPASHIVGFNTYVSVDNATFDFASGADYFAAFGKVTAVGSGYIDVELFGPDNIATQTASQQADRNLLGFIGSAIVSVGQVSALGAGIYRVYYVDALYGTAAATPGITNAIYFIERHKLVPIAHKDFAAGALRYFKLQTYTRAAQLDLSAVTSFGYTFGAGSAVAAPAYTPKVGPISIEDDTDATGVQHRRLRVAWLYPADQDIVYFETAIKGTGFVDWSYTKVAAPTFSVRVPYFGSWTIAVRAFNTYGETSDAGDPTTWACSAGKGIVAAVASARFKIDADGTLKGYNPDQNLWFSIGIRGASGAEELVITTPGTSS